MTSENRKTHESTKVQERMLGKKVTRSIGWEHFKDVFMVSAVHNLGSSDIEVSCYSLSDFVLNNIYKTIFS